MKTSEAVAIIHRGISREKEAIAGVPTSTGGFPAAVSAHYFSSVHRTDVEYL